LEINIILRPVSLLSASWNMTLERVNRGGIRTSIHIMAVCSREDKSVACPSHNTIRCLPVQK